MLLSCGRRVALSWAPRALTELMTGTMTTRIFHPNVSRAGEICVDTLKKGWKKEYGIGHVLVVS